MSSIRSFLLVRLLGGAAVILLAAGLLVYAIVARSLGEQFDQNLEDRVQGFASLLFQIEDHVEFEFSGELMPVYSPGQRSAYFQLWYADGRVLERSDSLGEQDLLVFDAAVSDGIPWSAALPDGRTGRYLRRTVEIHHVVPEEGPKRPRVHSIVLALAVAREDLVQAERKVLASCLGGALVLLTFIGLLSWRAVDRGLEPTRRLAQALSVLRVENLPDKLDVGVLPRELEPVAQTTDALIGRVSAALERERRTTADIAHELRTPIAEILATSEVALRNDRDPEVAARALVTVREVAARMGRSVATLLKLARLEMGAEALAPERIDVHELVRVLLRSYSALKNENRLVVETRIDEGASLEVDPEVLRIVLSNLLGNALAYSPTGGRVDIRVTSELERWRITIENEAPNLAREDLASMGEPFWRKDRSRADRQHSGLGLALTIALVRHGELDLQFHLEGGLLRAELGHSTAPRNEDEAAA